MKISEIITDKYKLRIPPTVYYDLLADVQEMEEEQEPTTKNDLGVDAVSRQAVIDCFKKVDEMKNNDEHRKSNEMLEMLRPYLEEINFSVETGKSASEQIYVPVLFSENDEVDKSFAADALSDDHTIVVEVEAGRAVFNNQFLKDIFQACMMYEVEYLVIAVLNEYKFKVKGNEYHASI